MQSVDEALTLIGQAAEDSGHDKVEEAQRMYAESKEKLEEAMTLLNGAKETADEYGSNL